MEASEKDGGTTLIETMIAVLVALIGVFSLGSLIFQATVTNKNQGTEVTRATIYAQDKMEKLLSLGSAGIISTTDANFASCDQSTTANPGPCNTSATWLLSGSPATWNATSGITGSGWNTGLLAGGALTPMQTSCPSAAPTMGYVDYLDTNGNALPLTAGSCSSIVTPIAYIRMWQIQDITTTGGPALKQISVAVWSLAAVGQAANKPVVLLTSYLSNPN